MFHITPGDVFRYKGELAECLQKTKHMLLIRTDDEVKMIDQRSKDFQNNVETVTTITFKADRRITVEEVLSITCEYFKLPTSFVTGRCRKREYVGPRFICQYLCTIYTDSSLWDIAGKFSNRDHSSIIHARDTIKDFLDTNDPICFDVTEIRKMVESRIAADAPVITEAIAI
jgi:chromosomal replication initiation ATPase DnaA